jgi:alpha-mannosidase
MSAAEGSFLKMADSNLLLETWKPAEDGNGTILRFLDFGGTERTVSVQIPWLRLDHVWQTDALERGQESLPTGEDDQFHFTIHPHEIVTIRAVGAGR